MVHKFKTTNRSCNTRQACRLLRTILVLALLAPSRLLAQPPPLQQPSADDVTVTSAPEFLMAMGNPSVQVVRLAADIALSADAVILGGSPSCGAPEVYQLTRNVTVAGPLGMDGPTDRRPKLDFTAITCVAPFSLRWPLYFSVCLSVYNVYGLPACLCFNLRLSRLIPYTCMHSVKSIRLCVQTDSPCCHASYESSSSLGTCLHACACHLLSYVARP